MSGFPNKEEIAEMESMLEQMEPLRNQIMKLSVEIPELKKTLETATETYADLVRRVTASMEHMDVAARGNFGWEKRVTIFLVELRAQAHAKGRSPI